MSIIETRELFVMLIRTATEVVWFIRRQFYFRASNKMAILIQKMTANISCIEKWTDFDSLGLAQILEAQEKDDMILLADILEGITIAQLQVTVYAINEHVPLDELDYLENNLKVMTGNRNLRGFAGILSAYAINRQASNRWKIEYTASGEVTVWSVEKEQYLSGNNNPYRDALDLTYSQYSDSRRHCVIFGSGLLFETQALSELQRDIKITIVEEDMDLLLFAFRYRDLTDILNKDNIKIVLSSYLNYFLSIDEKKDVVVLRKASLQCMKNDTEKNRLQQYFVKSMSIEEQKHFLTYNFYKNVKESVEPVDLIGADICGSTVCIVAGGPSLDDSMGVLKTMRPNVNIICVATAGEKLISHGIIPDYLILTDVADAMLERIKGIEAALQMYNCDMPGLLYLSTANHKAIEVYRGKKYIVCQKGVDESEHLAREKEFTLFETGGSVSTTALDLAIRLGAKEIICLGLDLAYTHDVSHATGTLGMRKIAKEDHLPRLKAVDGKEVYTSVNLAVYHNWIERRIQQEKTIRFVNVSDGAYIQGMENIPTHEAGNVVIGK